MSRGAAETLVTGHLRRNIGPTLLTLWRLRRKSALEPELQLPSAVPIVGAILCVTMTGYEGIRIIL